MKLFKKLMAVALAGAMALAVLTGCAATLDKRELIAYLNDTNSGVTFTDAGAKQAEALISKIKAAYDNAEDKAAFDPMDALFGADSEEEYQSKLDAARSAVGVKEDDLDRCEVRIGKMKELKGQMNKELADVTLFESVRPIMLAYGAGPYSDHGTISLSYVTLGDTEYFVAVVCGGNSRTHI